MPNRTYTSSTHNFYSLNRLAQRYKLCIWYNKLLAADFAIATQQDDDVLLSWLNAGGNEFSRARAGKEVRTVQVLI